MALRRVGRHSGTYPHAHHRAVHHVAISHHRTRVHTPHRHHKTPKPRQPKQK